jgi:hypothetical protein
MCCFSYDPAAPIDVSGTRIFARRIADGVQALMYDMTLGTAAEVAMILPLPTIAGEDAVQFVALDGYPELLGDLERTFMPPPKRGGAPLPAFQPQSLRVHKVGSFEASYVPRRADFSRLDPRFRLDDAVWDAVPEHRDSGFAVFQLRPGQSRIHPMAFTFRTREPRALFFPTLHVHDGKVHTNADFDHTLLAQGTAATRANEASWDTAGSRVRLDDARGLVADEVVFRRKLQGRLLNRDVRMPVA